LIDGIRRSLSIPKFQWVILLCSSLLIGLVIQATGLLEPSLDPTKPPFIASCVCGAIISFTLVGVYAMHQTLRGLQSHGGKFTWAISRKNSYWWIGVISAVLLMIALVISASTISALESPFANLSPLGALAVIVPFAMSVNMALIFDVQDEPDLDIILVCGRPVAWLVLERLAIVVVVHLLVGSVISVMGHFIKDEGPLWRVILYWVSAAVFLSGVGFSITIRSRQIVFGSLAAIALWGTMGSMSSVLMSSRPDLWFIYVYPPAPALTELEFILNRLFTLTLGIVLIVYSLFRLKDREWIYTGHSTIRLTPKGLKGQ